YGRRPRCKGNLTGCAKRSGAVMEHAMSEKFNSETAVIGIDIGKNSFHIVGQDRRGSIVLRQKWSRGCRPDRAAASGKTQRHNDASIADGSLPGGSINAVCLKHRLGDVETDCRNRLHG